MLTAMSCEPFPLWQARRAQPELAAVPVVACDKGRVLHASKEARAAGVERGMTLGAAQRYAAELHAVPASFPQLTTAWEALLEELYGLTPWLEGVAQGRALLRVPVGEAQEIARLYGARVGVSRYRDVALLAALAARPGEARHVEPGAEEAFLARLPLHFARGIGVSARSVERLAYLGVVSFGDLRVWRAPQLRAFLGKEAEPLLPVVVGPWREGVARYTPPPTLEASYTFEEPATEPAAVEPVLRLLATQLTAALAGRTANRLTAEVTAAGVRFSHTRVAKTPVKDLCSIERLASLALADTEAQALGIDVLSLRLSSLERVSVQGALWRTREQRQRAIDAVTARFPQALLRVETDNPFSLAREQRYRLVTVSTNRPPEVNREAETDAPRRTTGRDRPPEPRLVQKPPA